MSARTRERQLLEAAQPCLLPEAARVEVARQSDRLSRLQREQAQAHQKAVAERGYQAARTRAAGIYATPQEMDRDFYAYPHPAPACVPVMMTPDHADFILTNFNNDNRAESQGHVEHVMRLIVSGQWRWTHQGAAMDNRPMLQDGQHRLDAIRSVGIPVPMFFFVGMDPDNFKAIDEGKLRSASDLLSKSQESNTNHLAATLRIIIAYREADPRAAIRRKQSNASIYDTFHEHPQRLRDVVLWGVANRTHIRVMTATALAASSYLLYDANGWDNPYVTAFLAGLVQARKPDGVALERDDPRSRLRDMLTNRRIDGRRTASLDQVAVVIHAWNHMVADRRRQVVAVKKNMDMPRPTICAPSGAYASPPPPMLAGEVMDSAGGVGR